MADHDKIRILWIDDREEASRPERKLPQLLSRYFEVSHPYVSDNVQPFKNADQFAPVFSDFWFNDERSIMPVEIVAMDYNLRKWAPHQVDDRSEDEIHQALEQAPLPDNNFAQDSQESGVASGLADSINFEGLLIGLFYGSLTYEHPAGLVPMTFYSSQMPQEVDTLHALTEPFLGVDYRNYGMSHDERVWSNLIKQGVKQLRKRIAKLYGDGVIDISPMDLLALQESSSREVLTIHSRYCTRKLPLEGLFIDIPQEQKYAQASRWAEQLLQKIVRKEDFLQARELADFVWGKYDDDVLIEKRWRLSLMHAKKYLYGDELSEDEQSELDKLYDIFDIRDKNAKNPVCSDNCGDIRNGDYSNLVRRWAALLIIQRLLVRVVRARERCAGLKPEDNMLGIQTEDLYLALFPVAPNPLILPWHKKKKGGSPDFDSEAWGKRLHQWKDVNLKPSTKNGWGNLGLNLDHVLEGLGWNPSVGENACTFGLRSAERQILRGLMNDYGVAKEIWQNHGPARRVLLGKRKKIDG